MLISFKMQTCTCIFYRCFFSTTCGVSMSWKWYKMHIYVYMIRILYMNLCIYVCMSMYVSLYLSTFVSLCIPIFMFPWTSRGRTEYCRHSCTCECDCWHALSPDIHPCVYIRALFRFEMYVSEFCMYPKINEYQIWFIYLSLHRLLNARLQYLQCVSQEDTAVLHEAIDITLSHCASWC